MRERLLKNFSYPAFTESSPRSCRRLSEVSANKIKSSVTAVFADATGSWSELSELFRPDDWVGVTFDAKKKIKKIELLAPCLTEASPPQVPQPTLRQWALFLKTVREFFERRGFLEVQTPTLVVCPGTEPHLDVFATEFKQGQKRQRFFLPTSPELHLKKLIAAGYGPLYEIRPCFRNGEISSVHEPEFWMLEWYRPGQDLKAIQKDCQDLIRFCARKLKTKAPQKFMNEPMPGLFKKNLGLDLTPQTKPEILEAKARELGLHIPKDCDFDDLFFLLFLEKIESQLPSRAVTFVSDYPPSQAALARLTPEGWGDRFEMYWKGMELANAYHELNDPRVQRQRSQEDLEKRRRLGKQTVPLDENFFQALESGMPPTAGIALGLERLFLALTDRASLLELRLFPFNQDN